MPVYGPGSKCLGCVEKETEWPWFLRTGAPGNSHCTLTGTDSKAGGRDHLGLFLQAKSISERLP